MTQRVNRGPSWHGPSESEALDVAPGTFRDYSRAREARSCQSLQGLIAIPNDPESLQAPAAEDPRSLLSRLRQALDRGGRFLSRWGLPAALLTLVLQAGLSLLGDSATFDETAHLVAGYTYLDRWDFRLNPEHPPLAKMWAALPLWISSPGGVDYRSRAWEFADQWRLGFEFLNGPAESAARRDPRQRLMPARLMMLGWGIALAFVVYAWAHDLWGRTGGLVALFLCAFSPTILAHTRLVTTDVPAALGFVLPFWCLFRFLRRPGWRWGLALGGSLGLALLVKYSTLILILLLPISVILWALAPCEAGSARWKKLWIGLAGLAGAGITAAGCLWTCYGFRYRISPDPAYTLNWDSINLESGPLKKGIAIAKSAKLLPEAWLYGLGSMASNIRRESFLNGRVSDAGEWHYFPEAFLLKTTVPLLLLLGWAVAANFRRPSVPAIDLCFLAIPATCTFAVAIGMGMNIGHRHLAPIYPFLFIFAGGLSKASVPFSLREVLLAGLVALHAGSSILSFPRYLSYFNFMAGGSSGGSRYLGDSNLDWGHDLPRLRKWMDRNGVGEVHLAYFGTADPRAYGIHYKKVHFFIDFHSSAAASPPKSGEHLAVSVTFLQGLYAPPSMKAYFEEVGKKWSQVGRAGDSIYIFKAP